MSFFDTKLPSAEPTVARDKAYKPSRGDNLPDIDHLTEPDLVALLDRVQARLPPAKLSNLDLEEELVTQLSRAKSLQTQVLEDNDIPANQKAQVMNTVGSVIGDIIRMQERLYNAERFKAIEAMLLDSLRMLPKAQAEAFIEEYAKMGSTID